MYLLVACEDRCQYEAGTMLVDRVLAASGPRWLVELMEHEPAAARTWGEIEGTKYLDLHQVTQALRQHGLRPPYGHFDGRPGGPGAQMARNVFRLARHLRQQGQRIDAVLLLWDMDGQAEARQPGLEQAREEARRMGFGPIALGCPNHECEAWVLCAFEPGEPKEHALLQRERERLEFCPVEQSHRLKAKADAEPRSVKRVLETLTRSDPDRQRRCLREAALELLEKRGQHNGLALFLREVKEYLLPLWAPGPPMP